MKFDFFFFFFRSLDRIREYERHASDIFSKFRRLFSLYVIKYLKKEKESRDIIIYITLHFTFNLSRLKIKLFNSSTNILLKERKFSMHKHEEYISVDLQEFLRAVKTSLGIPTIFRCVNQINISNSTMIDRQYKILFLFLV